LSANASALRNRYLLSAILTGVLALVLILLALLDWKLVGSGNQWPVAQAEIIRAVPYYLRDSPRPPSDYPHEYGVTYRYMVNDQTYTGTTRFSVPPLRWEQIAAQYRVGRSMPVWYHPALPALSFASQITLVYDLVLVAAGAFLGIVTLTTLFRVPRLTQR
jgi:hypothetical protein